MSSNTIRSPLDHRPMITRVVIVGLFLALFASLGLPTDAAAESHRVTWRDTEEYRIADTGATSSISLTQGITVIGDERPSRIVRIELPGDATIDRVAITPLREVPLSPDARVSVPRDLEVDLPRLPTFESNGYVVRVLPDGDYLGHRIGHLLVTPFRDDGTGTHLLTDFTVDVDVRFDPGTPATALHRRISHPRTDRSDRGKLEALLDVTPRAADGSADVFRGVPPPELEPVTTEMLVVTVDALESVFAEFADIKTKEGIPTRVVTAEWILANYAGVDLPARIRDYIRDVYLYQGLRYVMLAGDTDLVPTRHLVSRFQETNGIPIFSDKYYSGLDGTWNADGDDELGEAPITTTGEPGDEVDFYPEIIIGRVPVSTITDAQTYVAKWKSYTGYDMANFRTDYQARVLALAEVLFPAEWTPDDDPEEIIIDGADISEQALAYFPTNWEFTRLYQYYDNPLHPGALPESREAAIAEWNTGYGFVDHVGHGFRANMSVGDGKIVNPDADALTNTNAYSMLYAVNCSSGAVLYDCINEHLLENPNGGIIASVAATDLDYPSISDVFKFEFFRLVFETEFTTVGDAFQLADFPWVPIAVVSENAYRWTILTLTCLGDPSLELWRETPRTMALNHPADHAIGDQSISVTVTETGAPVEGARVTAWKEDGYAVGVTDVTGVATLAFAPDSEGAFVVTAVKNGFTPESSPGTVIPSTTAALRVVDLTYHDGDGSGVGNGDGRPDAGERVIIDVTVRNDGVVTATGVSANLTTNSAFVNAVDPTASLPNIDAGQEGVALAAFEVDITTHLPDSLRHIVVPAEIQLTSDQGSWLDEIPLNVYQRMLDIIKLDWSIVNDNGNGFVDPGETIDIMLTAFNRGEAVGRGISGVVTFGGSDFVLLNDTVSFGDLDPGEAQIAGPISLLSTGGSQLTFAAEITLSDTYATADLLQRDLDILVPGAPDSLWAVPSARSVLLVWPLPASSGSDIRGYHVFRSDNPGGPFVEVSEDIVDVGTFFGDEGLTPLTTYLYKVRAIDWSGNVGPLTDELVTSTSPPILEGWPAPLPSGESKGSPTFADLERDGDLEIVLGWNNPMAFHHDGGDVVDGDNDAQTAGVFANIDDGTGTFWNSPFVWDVDLDGVNEIAYSAWHLDGESTGYLYLLDATGAIEPGWPQPIGRSGWGSPAIAELDGDQRAEIVLMSGESAGALRGALLAFNHDGTEVADGDSDPATNGVLYVGGPEARFWYGSPAVADLDDDGLDEIILAEKRKHSLPSEGQVNVIRGDGSIFPGFPYDDGGSLRGSTSSPAVADLDDNEDLEIIAAFDNALVVVNHDGSPFSTFPYTLPEVPGSASSIRDFLSSPAIGDVNNSGSLNIVLGWLAGALYCWDAVSGSLLSGFPAMMPVSGSPSDQYLRSPIVGNIDGTPEPEIVVSSGPNRLFAADHTGTLVSGFPLTLSGAVFGSAAIWDIDGNGTVNLIVQSNAPELTVYDFDNVPFHRAEHPWPMFRHNNRKTGRFTSPTAVAVEDEPASAPIAAVAFPPTPNPFSPRVELGFAVPQGGDEVRVRVFDVSGREVRALADGRFPSGEFQIAWDGRSANGSRLAAGQYFAAIEIGGKRFVQKLTLLR